MNCSPPGSSVHGILQARILEWVAISSSRGSSQPIDRARLSEIEIFIRQLKGLPGHSGSKESACNAGGLGLILGSGRSSGGGDGNPLQYSCLENPMVRVAWWVTAYRVAKSWTLLKWHSTACMHASWELPWDLKFNKEGCDKCFF